VLRKELKITREQNAKAALGPMPQDFERVMEKLRG
jgi:hypothetical protein